MERAPHSAAGGPGGGSDAGAARAGLAVRLGAAEFDLLPERAVSWPAGRTLLVADLHWGKDGSFRHHGIPVPRGDLDLELGRLADLVGRTGARRVCVLGDLVHDRLGLTDDLVEHIARFRRERLDEVELILVRGNHDRHVPRMPERWRIREVPEPFGLEAPGAPCLALAHDPAALQAGIPGAGDPHGVAHAFAGHLHPRVELRGAGDRIRLPCFHNVGNTTVLPAFVLWSSGPPVERVPGDRVFAIADRAVVEV